MPRAAPQAPRPNLWQVRRRALKKALAALRAGDPEGLHDVRVSLRRTTATASALGEKKIARRARDLARSLSERRQLEVDRLLLSRVGELGILSREVAAGLDARWDGLFQAGARAAEKIVTGRRMRRLFERLASRGAEPVADEVRLLHRARHRASRKLARPTASTSDQELHRFRLAVKRARYVAEDLALLGAPDAAAAAARLKAAQEALGRWNDLRLFGRRLSDTRREAERRGAVALALELDRLLAALDRTLVRARADALDAARPMANIVPLRRRTA